MLKNFSWKTWTETSVGDRHSSRNFLRQIVGAQV